MHEKKPARKFRLIDGQTGPKMAKLHEKKERFSQFLNCTFVADWNVFVALQTQKSGQMTPPQFPTPEL